MSEAIILDLTIKALYLVLLLSLPPIVLATLTGLMVSLMQALTQIQEQTLSFAVKLIVVIITIILSASWIGVELFKYADFIFDTFPRIVK